MEKNYKMVIGGNITFTESEIKNKYGSFSYLNISNLNKRTWSSWGLKKLGCIEFKLDVGLSSKQACQINFQESNFDEMEELYQYITERIDGIVKEENKDHIFKCNVCGHVFCYTTQDLRKNIKNAKSALASSKASLAASIIGTRYDMYEQNKMAHDMANKVIDFDRCPKCNSKNIVEVTEEELKQQSSSNGSLSPADEIKKYKQLLDEGIISQKEFDKKKKELLNL